MGVLVKSIVVSISTAILVGCGNGGSFSLPAETGDSDQGSSSPSTRVSVPKKSYVGVRAGAEVLLVEQGKSKTTGSHGWLKISSVGQTQLKSESENQILVFNSH